MKKQLGLEFPMLGQFFEISTVGTVARSVTSDTRKPAFESSHLKYYATFFYSIEILPTHGICQHLTVNMCPCLLVATWQDLSPQTIEGPGSNPIAGTFVNS